MSQYDCMDGVAGLITHVTILLHEPCGGGSSSNHPCHIEPCGVIHPLITHVHPLITHVTLNPVGWFTL